MNESRAAEPEVSEEDLKPGLIATHRDDTKPTPAEVVQLQPTIALALKAGEAVHPRLSSTDRCPRLRLTG